MKGYYNMDKNLKTKLIKKVTLNAKSSEIFEFNSGIAFVINRQTLYWFNSVGKLIFKYLPDTHFNYFPGGNIENPNIYKVIKVNNWLKVYFVNNMAIHVLADNTGFFMQNGWALWYYFETWNPLLSDAEINDTILSCDGQSITFKYPIENIQYYDNGFIVLANSHEFPRPENEKYLTLYSVSQDCKLRWQMEDYTKTDPIPEERAFELYNDRIDTFIIKDDLIYANTFGAIRLAIDAKTGKTVSYSSFAWRK